MLGLRDGMYTIGKRVPNGISTSRQPDTVTYNATLVSQVIGKDTVRRKHDPCTQFEASVKISYGALDNRRYL